MAALSTMKPPEAAAYEIAGAGYSVTAPAADCYPGTRLSSTLHRSSRSGQTSACPKTSSMLRDFGPFRHASPCRADLQITDNLHILRVANATKPETRSTTPAYLDSDDDTAGGCFMKPRRHGQTRERYVAGFTAGTCTGVDAYGPRPLCA